MSVSPELTNPQLACQVCLAQYDSQDHRPLLLPACGHTFCAFCLTYLYQQDKRFCPKCRKAGAVQPVTSLPVNYSLLDVAQNDSCGADAAVEPSPQSSITRTNLSRIPPPVAQCRLPRAVQNQSRISNSNRLLQQRFQRLAGRTTANPFVARDATTPAPAPRALGAASHDPVYTLLEREQQDELDFQMAVHLTFCKDESHDLDLHSNCSSW